MANWREFAIDAGMGLFRASGAHRLAAPYTRGLGAILTFHRVTLPLGESFAPNCGLEIAPEFFDSLLTHLRRRGFRILALGAALEELRAAPNLEQPFVVLTFDDGYRDFTRHALPALERR